MTMIGRLRARTVRGGVEEASFALGYWSTEDMQANALWATRFMRELTRSVSNKRMKISLKRSLFGVFEVAIRFDSGDEKAWEEARAAEAWADANRGRFGRQAGGA